MCLNPILVLKYFTSNYFSFTSNNSFFLTLLNSNCSITSDVKKGKTIFNLTREGRRRVATVRQQCQSKQRCRIRAGVLQRVDPHNPSRSRPVKEAVAGWKFVHTDEFRINYNGVRQRHSEDPSMVRSNDDPLLSTSPRSSGSRTTLGHGRTSRKET